MLDRVFEFLAHWGTLLLPLEIIDAYEAGVVLRWGKFHRIAEPGLCWKWPLAERALTAKTCITTMRLTPQTLTAKDGAQVVVTAIVKYRIADVKAFLLDVWDAVDVLGDTTAGAVRRAVESHCFGELVEAAWERDVLDRVRAEVERYGFKILRVTYADLGKVRSIRLITPTTSAVHSNTESGT